MQRFMAGLSDGISFGFPDLCRQGQHSAEDLADGRQVILGEPLPQLHKSGIQDRLRIQRLQYRLGLHAGLAIMQGRHDP